MTETQNTTKPPVSLPFANRLLWAGLAGAVMAACFPPVGLRLLLPVCLAVLIGLLNGVSVRQAVYLGFLFGLVWFLGDLFWFANLFGMAALSLCALLAFFIGLFAGLFVRLRERLPRIPIWLLAALLWTGVEVYRSEIFPLDFGWMGLGYGVVNAPVGARLASVVGSYGLSFGLIALAAWFAPFLIPGDGERRRDLLAPRLVFAVWLLACYLPLPRAQPENPLRVRLVQANSEDEDSLFGLSRAPSASPPDIIVWPEYSFVSDPKRNSKLWQKLANVAREQHCYFLFGAKHQIDPADDAAFYNRAYLLDPNGEIVGLHDKIHTVHFIRDGIRGLRADAQPTALGRLGVAICFDMDYPDVARRLARDGAVVFLVCNDDPPEWGWVQRVQHRLMFQMRAAECGRWLARADVAGGTSSAAPDGRETARVPTTQPAVLDVLVGRESGRTMYTRVGWLLGPLCFLASCALFLYALLPIRKKQPPPMPL